MTSTNANNPSSATKLKLQAAFWQRVLALAGLGFVSWLLSAAILGFHPGEGLRVSEFPVGEPAPRTVYSAMDTDYPDQRATQELQERAGKEVRPVYRILADRESENLSRFSKFAVAVEQKFLPASAETSQTAQMPAGAPHLSKPTAKLIENEPDWVRIRESVQSILQAAFTRGVFEPEEKQRLQGAGIAEVTLLKEGKPEIYFSVRDLLTSDDPKKVMDLFLDSETRANRSLKNAVFEITPQFFSVTVKRDDAETALRQKKAVEAVSPVLARIKKNELVAQRGILMTSEARTKLEWIEKAMARREGVSRFLGLSVLCLVVWLVVWGTNEILTASGKIQWPQRVLFHTTILLTLLLCRFAAWVPGASVEWMPTALASFLLVLLSGPRDAILAAVVMTVFAAPLSQNRMDVVIATLVSSFAAVLSGTKIRKRVQLLRMGTAVGASSWLIFVASRFLSGMSIDQAVTGTYPSFLNGFLLIVSLSYILVPIFESLFRLTTDISLLEMSDLNHPLLKKMIVEAPGTYHHSLVVSALSESACEAIGANALLARVGAYFHDIGKIAKSEFFTENQASPSGSKHTELSPKMSSMIIMNHVKEGIELGMKYKLRKPILDFIPEHQGTAVVYYFYRKALEEAAPGEAVEMNLFRYPGPKPQSRETAVVMLADSVEAASRSLKDYNSESIARVVRKIINDKFIDGQLEECNLTLKDLHAIQQSFVHNLMAIFHTRVTYPEKPVSAESGNLFSEPLEIPKPRPGWPWSGR